MDNIDLYIYSTNKGNTKKPGKYMFIIEMKTGKGPATLTGQPIEDEDLTGYRAELLAIVRALGRIRRACRITIHASNVTLMAALQNGWYKTWAENNYTNSKGDEISCAEEWKSFNEALKDNIIEEVVQDKHSYLSWMEMECNK